MESKNLAAQSYWNESYNDLTPFAAPATDPVRQWVEKHLLQVTNKTCLEIGAYPGRYLTIFGKFGYTLSGVDLAPGTTDQLPTFLKKLGFPVGQFFQADATTFHTDKHFDVVCSFGFIEHFQNFQDIILQHAALVRPNGKIVITTPNFNGKLQNLLHSKLDANNLKRHNTKAMDITIWKQTLETHGFTIDNAEYFGRFDFWTDKLPNSFISRLVFKIVHLVKPILRLLPNNQSWSAYAGIIATRKQE